MSAEEFPALQAVLDRRLHNTRDPELQALLWQMSEYADGMSARALFTEHYLNELYKSIKNFQEVMHADIPRRTLPGDSAGDE